MKDIDDPGQDVVPEADAAERGLAAKMVTYAAALRRWLAAGRPIRADEEVQRIYSTLCEPCAYFSRVRQRCKICGCRLNNGRLAITNKIRMATEHCPKEKW